MRDLRSSLKLTQAPALEILTLDEIKDHLRLERDYTTEDDYLTALREAVGGKLDGRDGELGRALLTQKWRLNLEGFYDPRTIGSACGGGAVAAAVASFSGIWNLYGAYYGEIKIPLPPLQTVDAVKYLDSNATLQTVDAGTYRVVDGGGSRSSIIPKPGFTWPSATLQAPDAVQIDFTAGYVSVDALAAERKGIVHAALGMIAHWYQNREAVTDGRINQPFEMPIFVDRLLAPHRLPVL